MMLPGRAVELQKEGVALTDIAERLGVTVQQVVMVMVQGDTADMYEADASGKLTGVYARWTPLTRDDGEIRGLFSVVPLTCTGALEAEGYTVVPIGEMTA